MVGNNEITEENMKNQIKLTMVRMMIRMHVNEWRFSSLVTTKLNLINLFPEHFQSLILIC